MTGRSSDADTLQCGNCGTELDREGADTVDGGREQIECDCGNILVECAKCGDFVSVLDSASGPGRKPVHKDCFDTQDVVDPKETAREERPNYSDRDSYVRRRLATAQHGIANARDWDDPRSKAQALREAKEELKVADRHLVEQIGDLNERIDACEAELEELENDD